MKFFNIIYCGTLFLMTTVSELSAQQAKQDRNILALEVQDSVGSWRNSKNAAGLVWDKPVAHSKIQLHYGSDQGSFRRPEEGLRTTVQGVYGAGNTEIKGSYIQGFFSYKRQKREEALYNSSLINPLREMPYRVLDSNASDWINQHYKMGFDWSGPKWCERWTLGLGLRYEASSGAKQRDIRAENTAYALQIRPGIVYALATSQRVGAHIFYANHKEESANSNVNVYVDQGYYLHYGLGHAIPYVGRGTNLNYEGDTWGAGLQYEWNGTWDIFAASAYGVGAERVGVGFIEARSEGMLLRKEIATDITAIKKYEGQLHLVGIGQQWSKSDGIEYWNEFVSGLESEGYVNRYRATRSRYKREKWHAKYSWIMGTETAYRWKVDASLAYRTQRDRYLLPISRLHVENLDYALGLSRAFDWRKAVLSIGVRAWRQHNLSGIYEYGGERVEEWPVNEWMDRELHYLQSSYWRVDLPLTLALKSDKGKGLEWYIRTNMFWVDPDGKVFTNRKGGDIALGMTF